MPGVGPPPKDPAKRQRRNKVTTRAVLPPMPSALEPPAEPPAQVYGSPGSPPESPAPAPAVPPAEQLRIPDLSPLPRKAKWDPSVLRWWREVWLSPMGERIPLSEVTSLEMIARLRQDFARAAKAQDRKSLAAEIRMQERRWGLDEMSRRSLQWEFGDGGPAIERESVGPPRRRDDGEDPRQMLRAIK